MNLLLATAFRMQCRVESILERDGTEAAATTGSGCGISYGFARDIVRALEGGDTEIDRLHLALRTIRDFPIPEQDNMLSANMRVIAREALGEASTGDANAD